MSVENIIARIPEPTRTLTTKTLPMRQTKNSIAGDTE